MSAQTGTRRTRTACECRWESLIKDMTLEVDQAMRLRRLHDAWARKRVYPKHDIFAKLDG